MFSRLLFGSQLSLLLGGIATLLSMAIGVPLGLFAGYRRGFADEAIMRTLDVMMAFPPIMLVLLILAVTPPSLLKTAIAIGVLSVPPIGPRDPQRDARSDERGIHRGGARTRRASGTSCCASCCPMSGRC